MEGVISKNHGNNASWLLVTTASPTELIKQSKLLAIKSKILSNLFNEKYGVK